MLTQDSGWRTVKLKDVCREITVGHVGPMASQYVDEGIPFLRSQNIQPFRIDRNDLRFIPPDFHEKLTKSALQPGDVVVVRTGYPGTACVVPTDLSPANCADLVIIRPSAEIDARFLVSIFNSTWGRGAIAGRLVGVAQQHFNIGAAKELAVLLPTLSIQRKLSAILSAYDGLIENNWRRIQILEEMAQNLYREWFVKFRFPGYQHTRFIDSPLGPIPEDWKVQRLDELCAAVMDGDWIETKDQGGEDYRLLQISNIGLGDFVETGKFRYVTQETFDRLRCTEIQPDDLLIARMPSPIGRGWLARKMPWRMITAVDVAIARPNRARVEPVYLVHFWNQRSTLEIIEKQSSGTTRLRITRRELCALPILTAPLELQTEFAAIAKSMFDLCNNLRHKNTTLRRTRDLLLPKLTSGELDVSALNIVVPEEAA